MHATAESRLSRRTLFGGLAGLAAASLLTGCAAGADSETLVVGSKGFAESWITGELYAQALRAQGRIVDLKTNVGSAQLIDTAQQSGQIDIFPEYTGVIAYNMAGNEEIFPSAEATYDFAKQWEEGRDVTVGTMTPFENKNAIAVTKDFAEEHGLQTIADLRGVGEFVYSTYPDNVEGGSGYRAIVERYNLPNMKLQTLSIGLNYQALEKGEIQAADVFTTDPQLLRSNLVVLDDPLNMFGFQNVVPLVHNRAMDRLGADGFELLNHINALLTTEAIQTMNAASAVNRLDPAQVARRFLRANGLA